MPEEEKKSSTKLVDIDTSGPEVDVTVPETKEETVATEKEPHEETTQDSPITDDTAEKSHERVDVRDSEDGQKHSPAKEDEKLEEYSRGVQNRISKLTRKMREAERREAAALDYAQAVESNRKEMESHFVKRDSVYNKKLEESVKTGMEAAEKELAGAIEAGNAPAQVEANKRIATLAFENAKIQQAKEYQEEAEKQPKSQHRLSDEQYLPRRTPRELPDPDPKAEDWAAKNRWFGSDRAMTFTAFEIHKDLVNKEGFDPKSEEYYKEVDRRIKLDFPHKFDKGGSVNTSEPVQTVASAKRSVKPGRQTVRLTSSQVAIAKKLGVPLEEYAKQLKITKEA
tara:strand:+ start:768 stop:1787 length:1020 start_codon:yes stop_codon:yes gene_type:complete